MITPVDRTTWETSGLYQNDEPEAGNEAGDETGNGNRSRKDSGSFYENVEAERYLDIARRLAISPTTSV